MQKTMDLFKQIKMYTMDSKPSPSEAPHIDSVIVELKKILNIIDSNEIKFNQVFYDELMFSKLKDENSTDEEDATFAEDSASFFMNDSVISSICESCFTLNSNTKFDHVTYDSESFSSSQSNSGSC